MWEYLRRHEAQVRSLLAQDHPRRAWAMGLGHHRRQLAHMQHERLIHLIVMLVTALFFLLTLGFATLVPSLPSGILSALLLALLAGYLVHYFRLENGVQRWYLLERQLEEKLEEAAGTAPRSADSSGCTRGHPPEP